MWTAKVLHWDKLDHRRSPLKRGAYCLKSLSTLFFPFKENFQMLCANLNPSSRRSTIWLYSALVQEEEGRKTSLKQQKLKSGYILYTGSAPRMQQLWVFLASSRNKRALLKLATHSDFIYQELQSDIFNIVLLGGKLIAFISTLKSACTDCSLDVSAKMCGR